MSNFVNFISFLKLFTEEQIWASYKILSFPAFSIIRYMFFISWNEEKKKLNAEKRDFANVSYCQS